MRSAWLLLALLIFIVNQSFAQYCHTQDTVKIFRHKTLFPSGLAISGRDRFAVSACRQDSFGKKAPVKVWRSRSRFMEGYRADDSVMLIAPQAVVYDTAGNLYVSQTQRNDSNIVVYDDRLRRVQVIDNATGAARWSLPRGLALDAAQNLYVISDDSMNATFSTRYPGTGKLVKITNPLGSASRSVMLTGLYAPKGIFIADTVAYITTFGDNKIRAYSINTFSLLDSVVVTRPMDLTVAECKAYATEHGTNTVKVFSSSSLPAAMTPNTIQRPTSNLGKYGIVVDRAKDLFFSTSDSNRVIFYRGMVSSAGGVRGTTPFCISRGYAAGNDTTGTWISSDTAIAIVDSSGYVSGVRAGTVTIYHISLISDTFYLSIEAPLGTTAGTLFTERGGVNIYDSTNTCLWYTRQLFSTGTVTWWRSLNEHKAIIGSDGNVWPQDTGNVTIVAYSGNSCGYDSSTYNFTIEPDPTIDTISGPDSVCQGTTYHFTNSVSGGSWSVGTSTIAGIDASGTLAGYGRGMVTITYTTRTICDSMKVYKSVYIKPSSRVGAISGISYLCVGSIAALHNDSTGGVWSSTPAGLSIAASGASAFVSSVAPGVYNVVYKNTVYGCGVDSATTSLTVIDTDRVAIFEVRSGGSLASPRTTICLGDTMLLIATPGTAPWSTGDASIASVSSSGFVSTHGHGTVTIFASGIGCTASSSITITVNDTSHASITAADTMCVGTPTSVSATPAGGTWSATTPAVVLSGLVTGLSAGTGIITYTYSGACNSGAVYHSIRFIEVRASAITGRTTLCLGDTTSLSDSVSGGIWGSVTGRVTFTGTTGRVYRLGSDTIFYAISNMCGTDTAYLPVTVATVPTATVSGPSIVCPGSTITVTGTPSGGGWSTTTTSSTITSGGVLTGGTPGFATIFYTYNDVCGSDTEAYVVIVSAFPDAGTITGPAHFCDSTVDTVVSSAPGGRWYMADTNATITATSGVFTGLHAGADTIIYIWSNSCGSDTSYLPVNILPYVVPSVSITSSTDSLCIGDTVSFAATSSFAGTSPFYEWQLFGTPFDTGRTTRYAPALGDVVTCVLHSSEACPIPPIVTSNARTMYVMPRVTPSVTVAVTPSDSVAYGLPVAFYAFPTFGGSGVRYQWFVNGAAVSGATNRSYTKNIYTRESVWCVITSDAECITAYTATSNVITMVVYNLGIEELSSFNPVQIYPNPNDGHFTIDASVGNSSSECIVELRDMQGRLVYTGSFVPDGGRIFGDVSVSNLAAGTYVLRVINNENILTHPVMVK